jgi:hypothetical protein
MKAFILALVCVLCFSVSSCMNTIKNVPVIAATGTTAYIGHESVVEVVIANLDIFSSRELQQLTNVNDRICIVKDKIDEMREHRDDDAVKLVMDLPRLLPLYSEAKEAYLVAHGIIMNRIDEFSIADRGILMSYSNTCARLDFAIQEAVTSEDGTNNAQLVKDIMSFVFLVGKIVLPMLIVL